MDIDPSLLERYWKGECSAVERQKVKAWLEAGEPTGNETWPKTDREAKAELWDAINQHMEKSIPNAVPQMPTRSRPQWLFAGVAACLLVLSGMAFLYWKVLVPQPAAIVELAEMRELTAPQGKKLEIMLPDSTVVHLNSGSSIKYPERFDGKQRLVHLSGEAYFNVNRQPDRPFVVAAADTHTEVLGTRFNVRTFPDEEGVSVVVEEGKVRFSAYQQEGVLLTANQRATYQLNDLSVDMVYAQDHIAWKDNQLVFRDEPLVAVIPLLERWYDIKIALADDSLGSLHIRGSFNNPSLHTLLHDLAYSLNLNYAINDKKITLYR